MKKVPFDKNDLTNLSGEQIAAFKETFKAVYCIEVEDKKCFLHPPTRQILDAANAASKKANSKFNEVVLKGCWLAGDKELVEDDEYFLAASTQLDEIITIKDASLKKL